MIVYIIAKNTGRVWDLKKSFPAGNFLANITSAQGALPLIPYKFDPQFIFPCTILNVPMYNRLFIFPPSRDIVT